MNYKDIKKIKISEITPDILKEILKNEKTEILKCINYFKWKYKYTQDLDELKILNKILSNKTIKKYCEDNNITGEQENINIIDEENENFISIDDKNYIIKTVLKDDFERLIIVEDEDTMLHKYGLIIEKNHIYVYELIEEEQSFLRDIINSDDGIKVNLYSHVDGDDIIQKTFIKTQKDFNLDLDIKLVKKTSLGIIESNKGLVKKIKQEKVLSNNFFNEYKVQNALSDYKKLIEKKFNIDLSKVDETEKLEDVVIYDDQFSFSDTLYFSIVPYKKDNVKWYTHVLLYYHGVDDKFENIEDKQNNELIGLLNIYKCESVIDGVWSIDKLKLDMIVMKLLNSNCRVEIKDEKLIKTKDILTYDIYDNLEFQRKLNVGDIEDLIYTTGLEAPYMFDKEKTIIQAIKRVYGDNHVVFINNKYIVVYKFKTFDKDKFVLFSKSNLHNYFYVIENNSEKLMYNN